MASDLRFKMFKNQNHSAVQDTSRFIKKYPYEKSY